MNLRPFRTFLIGWNTGLAGGLAMGLLEGLTALTGDKELFDFLTDRLASLPTVVRLLWVPAAFDALLFGLLCGVLALALALLHRLMPGTAASSLPGLITGSGTALIFLTYLLLQEYEPPYLQAVFGRADSLFRNGWLVILAALAGIAVGSLVHRLRRQSRASKWAERGFAFGVSVLVFLPLIHWLIAGETIRRWPAALRLLAPIAALAALAISARLLLMLFDHHRRPGSVRSALEGHAAPGDPVLSPAGLPPGHASSGIPGSFKAAFPAALFLAAALLLLPAGGKKSASTPLPLLEDGTGVILVTVDTLRADRISSIRPGHAYTPNLDRLATGPGGVLFTNVQAQSPWTLTSFCSLMTSLYPTTCGVVSPTMRLHQKQITLAECMAEAGYFTQGMVVNAWLEPSFGLDQGFHRYRHFDLERPQQYWDGMLCFLVAKRLFPRKMAPPVVTDDSGPLVDAAIAFVEQYGGARYFLWLHLLDPHEPYTPKGRFSQYAGQGYRGAIPLKDSGEVVDLRRGKSLSSLDRKHIEKLYDLEVEYLDEQVGRLIDAVGEKSLWDRTLFVFTSDHGEEFWEHENVSHGHTLYDEVTHVPLIFRFPDTGNVARQRIEAQVRLLDLAPTMLDSLGLQVPPEMQGRSLLPWIRGEEDPVSEPSFAEAAMYYFERKSVRTGRHKYVRLDTGAEKLFDLLEDPEEQNNLVLSEPDLRTHLSDQLDRHLAEQAELRRHLSESGEAGQEVEMDEATRNRLRALGYLQ